MSEPPHKRPRRYGEDTDRSRDSRRDRRDRNPPGGRDHERDSHRDRERRDGSQEHGGDRDRNREGESLRSRRRDEPRDRERERFRERDDGRGDSKRDDGRERSKRDEGREGDTRGTARGGDERNKDRGRERKRPREDDVDGRSRSPRRDSVRNAESRGEPETVRAVPKEMLDEARSRTSTPPVAFKVQQPEKILTGPSSKRGPQHQPLVDDVWRPPSAEPQGMDMDGPRAGKKDRKTRKNQKMVKAEEDGDDGIEVDHDSMAAMQAMLGFGGFGSTHQKKVAGNDVSGIRKEKKTEYRQYMNRVGGFNRALSPARES